MTLLFLDLDRFKKINDTLGHDIGDKVIHIAGERIKRCLGGEDIVARWGGDEFLVLFKHRTKEKRVMRMIEEILKALKSPIYIGEYILYTSASIGISCYPSDNTDAYTLLKYADTAMYKAKEEGGNNYQFYTPLVSILAEEQMVMERDLRESLTNKNFEVYYQPQVNINTHKITGVEALIRWNHPLLGQLTPDIFIPLAEKTGLLLELDLWVMKQAIEDISLCYKEGLDVGRLSLNACMKQLEHLPFIEEIKRNSVLFDFDLEWLEIEITETEMMKKPEMVILVLEALHTLGISVAIDDFGTGYSSLSHLKRLSIDRLKIDKSFIADISKDSDAVVIVKTIIALAQSLHLGIVAEGVEHREQKEFLHAYGCDTIQGYYYSKPLNIQELKLFIQEQGF